MRKDIHCLVVQIAKERLIALLESHATYRSPVAYLDVGPIDHERALIFRHRI